MRRSAVRFNRFRLPSLGVRQGDFPIKELGSPVLANVVVCSTNGVLTMRLFTMAMIGLVCSGTTVLAMANPALLPKHPGYPSSGDYANDTGQLSMTHSQSLAEAAKSGDTTMGVTSMDPTNARLLEHQGAGRLPIVQGANIKIDPPVSTGAEMPKK